MDTVKNEQLKIENIFKCKDNIRLKEEYTKKWIELINRIEKSKEINPK